MQCAKKGDDTVIKVFIDFADVVSICLKDDRKLCYFTAFDYSETLLDNIYAVLSDVKVTSATVVLHGRLGGVPGGVVVLPGASVFEPVGDVKAIDHLLKAAGIPVIEYFEFAGYYLSQGKQNVLFIDQEASVINLIVYKDHVVTMQLCTEALLQQTVRALYNQYELTEVVDVKNLVIPALLNYFDNINSVYREDVLPVLSLFAFTLTTLASPYLVDTSRLDFSSNNNAGTPEHEIKEEILPGPETADSCENPLDEVKGKKKKVRRKPDVPKEKIQREPVAAGRRGLLKFLSVILVFLLAVVLVASIAGNSILSFIVGQKQKSIADLTAIYQANQNTVQSYQRMEQSLFGNEICMSGVELAGKLDLSKSIDNYISVTNTGINYVGYFKTERNAKAFLNNVKKAATITSSRVAKSKKGTYQCKLAAATA